MQFDTDVEIQQENLLNYTPKEIDYEKHKLIARSSSSVSLLFYKICS